MSNVLVTGGAGFIGSHLVEALLDTGHRVTVVDNFFSGNLNNLQAVRDRITLIEGDVIDAASWSEGLAPFDVIFHLAALISGYDSLSHPDAYVDSNILGLIRIIELGSRNPNTRIIFASSSTVYGNQEIGALDERAAAQPLTVYALSKLAGEHLLRLYGQLHGFTHCSLRLFNVYGPRQTPEHPYANVTCKFAHAAATGGSVKLYGDGNQSRDFIFVDDVVRAFEAVISQSTEHVYNVGTGSTASVNELVEMLGGISGSPLDVQQEEPWPNDIRSICSNPGLLDAEFGVGARVPLRKGLEQTVNYFVDQLPPRP